MEGPFRIWCLEDDESDILFLSRALREAASDHVMTHFENPLQAIEALERLADPARELPHLILTDLKMPIMDGLEFVKWLRASPFALVPVVVLSSSNLSQDIRSAYQAGFNSWITKPNSYKALVETFQAMIQYWRNPSQMGYKVPG
jgi:CheY-like chemotaxis protein